VRLEATFFPAWDYHSKANVLAHPARIPNQDPSLRNENLAMLIQRFFQIGLCSRLLAMTVALSTLHGPSILAQDQPASLFPDAGLEAAVRAEVFEKRYNTEPLTVDDVKKISRVIGIGKNIQSLEGMQHCASVMLIDLGDNQITDLAPLAGLKKLQSVTLSKNKIKDLQPLAELTAIQLLDIADNEVESLDAVKKMSNLRSLWLPNNKVKSLEPLSELPKIWSLDVAGNGLSDITSVGNLKWLTNLDLDRNNIESIEPLQGLTELDILLVRENKIQDLTVLVDMCRKDSEGAKRFAPYLRLYLRGNPLNDKAQTEQLSALKDVGVRVSMD
jgi:internalin A